MALTENQKSKILDALREKARSACPMCTANKWTLGDQIVGMNAISLHGSIAIGGPVVPMVQVICNNCGFVSHHAAGVLGVKLQ